MPAIGLGKKMNSFLKRLPSLKSRPLHLVRMVQPARRRIRYVKVDSPIKSLRNTSNYRACYDRTVVKEEAYLNMVVTNGLFFVGTRYVTDPKEEPLTLYHSEGSRYVVEDGITRMFAPEDDDHAVLVVSEKLTDDANWTMIPKNHLVIVEQTLNVRIKPIHA